MSTETIYKLQPDRTLYLRGFTGFGAAAALHSASPTGFTVSGVFRDMADFCVLNLYDADNQFEHYSVRYLPDFNLDGLVLSFDVATTGLQPIDSAKYPWIPWPQLSYIRPSGDSASDIRLWDHAHLLSGNYSVAQGTVRFTTGAAGCTHYDRLTLFVNDVIFDFVANGAESAADVANFFAAGINQYDWSNFAGHNISVLATAAADGSLTFKNARTGLVQGTGRTVHLASGTVFTGIAPGSTIWIAAASYTVASVDAPNQLTLTTPLAADLTAPRAYLAEYGGVDGNGVTLQFIVRPANQSLTVDQPSLALAGGNSDNVTWRVTLDFTALGLSALRQAWLTFAPQLAPGAAYRDTEWSAIFSNWTVADPNDIRPLPCAAPGSLRVGNGDTTDCTYQGTGWTTLSANNYWRGFARQTSHVGDTVTITYTQNNAHHLYLGSQFSVGATTLDCLVDGQPIPSANAQVHFDAVTVTRRLLQSNLPAGTHTVTLTANATAPLFFDFLEAAIPGDLPDASVIYPNASPALDFDTDATYKVSPQRLLWHLLKLGFHGQLNEYLGVFWWNQRKRVGGQIGSADVIFTGDWTQGPPATLTLGGTVVLKKDLTGWDTPDTVAAHFSHYINSGSVSMWAEPVAPGTLRIHSRTPSWGDTLAVSSDNRISATANAIPVGHDGIWTVDPSASTPLNRAVTDWHTDFFQLVAQAGLSITTSFSMELVNPPDDGTPGNEWVARYADGSAVTTDTGFANLNSSQCSFLPNMTAYQQSVYCTMAGLQKHAGLTPWLQFGEFLWWFFSSYSKPVGYVAYTDPISIGVADPHGFSTGDRVVISGVAGCLAANGTWPVTVTDATHFTIPASADGAWVAGTGLIRGGSMAFYDVLTQAAAQRSLGRPLFRFTCQDDDPAVHDGADVTFLAGRLQNHVDAIRQAVLAQYPDAHFELLYPNDVNHPVCYLGPSVPYPQGGRLNAAVNLPAAWMAKETSGLHRLKVEALSWGAQYLNLTLAKQAISFACTTPMQWAVEDVAYLVPWFNGTCPWPTEYTYAKSLLPLINFWAYDHLALLSWPLPFPTDARLFSQFK